VQWRVEDGGNGHWYQVDPQLRSWSDANSLAIGGGGHLATVQSAEENAFVFALTTTPPPGINRSCWLGGYQEPGSCEPGCGWRWVTQEPFNFTLWAPGEPNNDVDNENCLHIWVTDRWNDARPSFLSESVIEWSADCNSDGIVDYGQILDGSLSDVNADGVPDACQAPCVPSDLNNDGAVDGSDLGALLSDWGPAAGQGTRADANGDGIVNGADLGTLLANWGPCGATPTWATVIQWQPDPSVVTDAQLRAAILATGLPWRVRDTGTGIEMLLVPSGTFQMGCSPSVQHACAQSESPVHQVTLTRAYYLGRYEVTQAQWMATMGSNPSTWPGAELPVNRVEREIISTFLSSTGMRLPTEAEWEWAYRAGTTTAFHGFDGQPSGTNDDTLLPSIAWYSANSDGQTRPVGGKPGNGFGLHDMSGNVSEWVQAWFAEYPSAPQVDPTGPTIPPSPSCYVIRGGSWADSASSARSSARSACGAGAITLGFRVARTP